MGAQIRRSSYHGSLLCRRLDGGEGIFKRVSCICTAFGCFNIARLFVSGVEVIAYRMVVLGGVLGRVSPHACATVSCFTTL